jgi:hypothetical protein
LSALEIALLVFLCCCGAALAGLVLHSKLPDNHLDGDSKDAVKLVMGLIATLAALVLGLLIASAKTSYDTQAAEMQQLAASIMQLDRMLVLYGPETREARDALKQAVTEVHQTIWPASNSQRANLDPSLNRNQADIFYEKLESLSPKTEAQRNAQNAALQLGTTLAQTRMLMFEQVNGSIAWPFLMILVFWVSVLFLGFGLFARFHITIAVALIVGALSVSSAVFLILELNTPYQGMMQLSDAAFRNALSHIDR